MKIQDIPFTIIDWEQITFEKYKGETGTLTFFG